VSLLIFNALFPRQAFTLNAARVKSGCSSIHPQMISCKWVASQFFALSAFYPKTGAYFSGIAPRLVEEMQETR